MKKQNKEEIKDRLESIDFEGPLFDTLGFLKSKTNGYKKQGYTKFEVDKEREWDYGDQDGYDVYWLFGTRLETDEEFDKRIANNKKRVATAKKAAKTRAAKKEERDHEKYLNLRMKYEGR